MAEDGKELPVGDELEVERSEPPALAGGGQRGGLGAAAFEAEDEFARHARRLPAQTASGKYTLNFVPKK